MKDKNSSNKNSEQSRFDGRFGQVNKNVNGEKKSPNKNKNNLKK